MSREMSRMRLLLPLDRRSITAAHSDRPENVSWQRPFHRRNRQELPHEADSECPKNTLPATARGPPPAAMTLIYEPSHTITRRPGRAGA